MAEKKMIKPIKFIDFNQCPNCLGTLIFKEVEIYSAPLDENGVANAEKGVTFCEPRLVCPKCGRVYDCKRVGIGYRIDFHLPEVKPIMKNNNPFYK